LTSLPRRFTDLLDRLGLSEGALLTLVSVLVGLLTGAASILFIWLSEGVVLLLGGLGGWLGGLATVAVILVPALGGLLAGLIVYRVPETRGGGIPQVMEAMALKGGRIRRRVVPAKMAATAACIGSGGSAGRVGPVVQVGAALGSTVGRLFRLSDARVRNLVASGAAAGIAATFNAPIAGVIFALEVVLGEFSAAYFATIVITAVTATVVSQNVLGTAPAFTVPAYTLRNPLEIVFYLLLGCLAPFVAWLFVSALYAVRDLFDDVIHLPEFLEPALGGLALGLVGLVLPRVLGTGFGETEVALYGNLPLQLMVLLAGAKIVATALTLGSGSSGGVFAPALFVGASFGGAYGALLRLSLPDHLLGPVGAYALVGMAAVFAGAAHAPMTAMLIIFEMSDSYEMILPLMLATGISTVVSRYLRRDSLYTLALARRGIRLEQGRAVDVLQGVRVDEVMTEEVVIAYLGSSLAELEALFDRVRHHGFPVVDADERLAGMVTLEDLSRAQERWEDWPAHRVGEACSLLEEVYVAFPQESVAEVLRRLSVHDVSCLPVVERGDRRELVGLVCRSDIVRGYRRALLRRQTVVRHEPRAHVEGLVDTDLLEVDVGGSSSLVGRAIRDVPWPEDCLVVAVHRGGEVLVGKGEVVMRPGDRLTVYAGKRCQQLLPPLLRGD
jgi:CIC family chloride channel protein